jgi:hypothetical protein
MNIDIKVHLLSLVSKKVVLFMYKDQQFQLISKALNSTQKSLEEQIGIESLALHEIGTAKEDMIKALAHATSIDHQIIIDTLFDK